MTAFIYVTDSRWTAKTGANGIAQFTNAPDGSARIAVWHPYLRAKANVVEQQLAASQRKANFTVALRPAPMAMSHDALLERDGAQVLDVPRQRHLIVGAAVDIFEQEMRQPRPGKRAKVADRGRCLRQLSSRSWGRDGRLCGAGPARRGTWRRA